MKKMKITTSEIFTKELFSKEPYRFGKEIFTAVKEGNNEKVWRILIENKYAIFSIDHT